LCAGKSGGFDELFGFLGEGIGGLQKRDENAVLQGNGRVRGFGTRVHKNNLVVITTTVKRQLQGRASLLA